MRRRQVRPAGIGRFRVVTFAFAASMLAGGLSTALASGAPADSDVRVVPLTTSSAEAAISSGSPLEAGLGAASSYKFALARAVQREVAGLPLEPGKRCEYTITVSNGQIAYVRPGPCTFDVSVANLVIARLSGKLVPPLEGGDRGAGSFSMAICTKGNPCSTVSRDVDASVDPASKLGHAPIYPMGELHKGRSGLVKMLVLVGVSGEIKDVRISQSSGQRDFDASALTAVRSWKMRPCVHEGVATECYVQVPVSFAASP